jgi:glycosyltransferase involved in cell wall biosynthesis
LVGISCIICTYNEAGRIGAILDAVVNNPAISEVIVVDDGSSDGTPAVLRAYPSLKVIAYAPNRGKTHAMSRGIAAASQDHLMFLDADLAGITSWSIERLAAPVREGRADATMSLRGNSLGIYKWLGIDFVTGERVIPASLVKDKVEVMANLPRWGAEVFLNDLAVAAGLSIAVVRWPSVDNVRKYAKFGLLQGLISEIGMVADALKVISPLGIVRQHLGLLGLMQQPAGALPWRKALAKATRRLQAWP